MRSLFQIVKQEFPETSKPYRIIEMLITSDGIRSRICEGCWVTFDEAKENAENRGLEDAFSDVNVQRSDKAADLQEVRGPQENDS